MKKGLVNPVLSTIRSANQPSTRYSMPIPQSTYTQSIENMAGSGYNKNSKKLRILYDDAKGIAIGARPNPDQNKKRFWGLYGQQANTKPHQATAEVNNYMRQNIDGLRYGNTNRRIAKNSNIKKESYYNTLGGGHNPNVVVQPKKGRPYKGQPDSLPLIAKREKLSKKIYEWEKDKNGFMVIRSDSNIPKKKISDQLPKVKERQKQNWFDTTGWKLNEDGNLISDEYGNPFIFPESKVGQNIDEFGFKKPSTIIGGTLKKPKRRGLTQDEEYNLVENNAYNMIPEYEKYAFVPQYTNLPRAGLKAPRAWYDPRKYINPDSLLGSSLQLGAHIGTSPAVAGTVGAALAPQTQELAVKAGKKALQGAKFLAGTIIPPTVLDEAGKVGKKTLEYIGYGDKIAPYLKNPKIKGVVESAGKNFRTPANLAAGAVTWLTDVPAAISSANNYELAESMEGGYNYPTTMQYTSSKQSKPIVVSQKTGEAANRKSGNLVNFLNLISSGLSGAFSASQIANNLPEFIANNIQSRNDTSSKQKARNAFELSRRGYGRPALSASAEAKITAMGEPKKLIPNPQNTQEPQLKFKNGANAYPLRSPLNLAQQAVNWLDQNSVLGDASEFEGRKRLPAKFSDLPLREQQEYARFGKPVETRIKPSRIRAFNEGIASAYTGNMMIPQSYNQNIENDPFATYDYWFLDQMAHRGASKGPLTEVYGYDKNGDLKALRVSRPVEGSQNVSGKNMSPFVQIPASDRDIASPATQNFYTSDTFDENLFSRYMRNKYGEDMVGNYTPKILGEQIKSGYYDDYMGSNDLMYGVQLSRPFVDAQNWAPTYIPETEQETRAQQAKRFTLNAQTNPLNLDFGKSMKKSIAPMKNATNNNVVGGLHAKSLSKSMLKNKTLSPSSHTSLKHSNKYAK